MIVGILTQYGPETGLKMIVGILTQYGPETGLKMIRGGVEALRKDYQINIDKKLFEEWPGVVLTFEEFLSMLLLEKDHQMHAMAYAHAKSEGPSRE